MSDRSHKKEDTIHSQPSDPSLSSKSNPQQGYLGAQTTQSGTASQRLPPEPPRIDPPSFVLPPKLKRGHTERKLLFGSDAISAATLPKGVKSGKNNQMTTDYDPAAGALSMSTYNNSNSNHPAKLNKQGSRRNLLETPPPSVGSASATSTPLIFPQIALDIPPISSSTNGNGPPSTPLFGTSSTPTTPSTPRHHFTKHRYQKHHHNSGQHSIIGSALNSSHNSEHDVPSGGDSSSGSDRLSRSMFSGHDSPTPSGNYSPLPQNALLGVTPGGSSSRTSGRSLSGLSPTHRPSDGFTNQDTADSLSRLKLAHNLSGPAHDTNRKLAAHHRTNSEQYSGGLGDSIRYNQTNSTRNMAYGHTMDGELHNEDDSDSFLGPIELDEMYLATQPSHFNTRPSDAGHLTPQQQQPDQENDSNGVLFTTSDAGIPSQPGDQQQQTSKTNTNSNASSKGLPASQQSYNISDIPSNSSFDSHALQHHHTAILDPNLQGVTYPGGTQPKQGLTELQLQKFKEAQREDRKQRRRIAKQQRRRQREIDSITGLKRKDLMTRRDRIVGYHKYRSLFLFQPTNPFRKICIYLAHNKFVDWFLLLVVVFSIYFIASATKQDNIDMVDDKTIYYYAELAVSLVFSIEFIIKIIAFGFIDSGPHSYFRSDILYNGVDFLTLVLGWVSLTNLPPSQFWVRQLRILRLFKIVHSLEGIRLQLSAISRALPSLGSVLVFAMYIALVFALIFHQLAMGKFSYRCVPEGSPVIDDDLIIGGPLCSIIPFWGKQCGAGEICTNVGENPDYGVTSFDNIIISWYNMIVSLSMEGWSSIMYHYMSVADFGALTAILWVLLMVIGGFIAIKLISAVLKTSYEESKARETQRQRLLVTRKKMQVLAEKKRQLLEDRRQKERDAFRRQMLAQNNSNPSNITFPPHLIEDSDQESADRLERCLKDSCCNCLLYGGMSQNRYDMAKHRQKKMKHQKGELYGCFSEKSICVRNPIRLAIRSFLYDTTLWTWATIIVVVYNTIILAIQHYGSTDHLDTVTQISVLACLCFFVLDIILKAFGSGPKDYINDRFNLMELVITIASIIHFVIERDGALSSLHLLRVLRLINMKTTDIATRYFIRTIITSAKDTALSAFILLGFVFFAAIIGRAILEGKMIDNGQPARQNFNSFFWSVVTIFQVMTPENWNDVAYFAKAGAGWGGLIFISVIMFFGFYIVVSLFLAVMLANFGSNNAARDIELQEQEMIEKEQVDRALAAIFDQDLHLHHHLSPHHDSDGDDHVSDPSHQHTPFASTIRQDEHEPNQRYDQQIPHDKWSKHGVTPPHAVSGSGSSNRDGSTPHTTTGSSTTTTLAGPSPHNAITPYTPPTEHTPYAYNPEDPSHALIQQAYLYAGNEEVTDDSDDDEDDDDDGDGDDTHGHVVVPSHRPLPPPPGYPSDIRVTTTIDDISFSGQQNISPRLQLGRAGSSEYYNSMSHSTSAPTPLPEYFQQINNKIQSNINHPSNPLYFIHIPWHYQLTLSASLWERLYYLCCFRKQKQWSEDHVSSPDELYNAAVFDSRLHPHDFKRARIDDVIQRRSQKIQERLLATGRLKEVDISTVAGHQLDPRDIATSMTYPSSAALVPSATFANFQRDSQLMDRPSTMGMGSGMGSPIAHGPYRSPTLNGHGVNNPHIRNQTVLMFDETIQTMPDIAYIRQHMQNQKRITIERLTIRQIEHVRDLTAFQKALERATEEQKRKEDRKQRKKRAKEKSDKHAALIRSQSQLSVAQSPHTNNVLHSSFRTSDKHTQSRGGDVEMTDIAKDRRSSSPSPQISMPIKSGRRESRVLGLIPQLTLNASSTSQAETNQLEMQTLSPRRSTRRGSLSTIEIPPQLQMMPITPRASGKGLQSPPHVRKDGKDQSPRLSGAVGHGGAPITPTTIGETVSSTPDHSEAKNNPTTSIVRIQAVIRGLSTQIHHDYEEHTKLTHLATVEGISEFDIAAQHLCDEYGVTSLDELLQYHPDLEAKLPSPPPPPLLMSLRIDDTPDLRRCREAIAISQQQWDEDRLEELALELIEEESHSGAESPSMGAMQPTGITRRRSSSSRRALHLPSQSRPVHDSAGGGVTPPGGMSPATTATPAPGSIAPGSTNAGANGRLNIPRRPSMIPQTPDVGANAEPRRLSTVGGVTPHRQSVYASMAQQEVARQQAFDQKKQYKALQKQMATANKIMARSLKRRQRRYNAHALAQQQQRYETTDTSLSLMSPRSQIHPPPAYPPQQNSSEFKYSNIEEVFNEADIFKRPMTENDRLKAYEMQILQWNKQQDEQQRYTKKTTGIVVPKVWPPPHVVFDDDDERRDLTSYPKCSWFEGKYCITWCPCHFKMRYRNYTCFGVSSRNPIRTLIRRVVEHPIYELAIILLVLISCILLAIEQPQEYLDGEVRTASLRAEVVFYSNISILVIFILDFLFKIAVYGLFMGKNAYLWDPWNLFDFVAVGTFAASYFVDAGANYAPLLRSLRGLRAVRFIYLFQSTREVMANIVKSIRQSGVVTLFGLMLFLIYGIIGVAFFKGRLRRCYDFAAGADAREWLPGIDEATCIGLLNHIWINPLNVGNFDNIGNALLVLLQFANMEAWPVYMYLLSDATPPGQAPEENYNPYAALYVVFGVLIFGFFFLSLLIGAIVDAYQNAVSTDLNPIQSDWLEIYQLILDHKPPGLLLPPAPPTNMSENKEFLIRYRYNAIIEMINHQTNMHLPAPPHGQAMLHHRPPGATASAPRVNTGGPSRQPSSAALDDALTPKSLSTVKQESGVESRDLSLVESTTETVSGGADGRISLQTPSTSQTSSSSRSFGLHALQFSTPLPMVNHTGDSFQQAAPELLTTQEISFLLSYLYKLRQTIDLLDQPQPWYSFRRWCYDLLTWQHFTDMTMVILFINILALAILYPQINPGFKSFLNIVHACCSILLIIEFLLKLLALGPTQYFSKYNPVFILEFIVMLCGLIEFVTVYPFDTVDWSSIYLSPNIFGITRLIRLVLLTSQRFRFMRTLVNTIIFSFTALYNVGFIFIIVIFVYGVVGMHLFAGVEYGEFYNEESNFNGFFRSIILLFQAITGENWIHIMYELGIDHDGFCDAANHGCGNKAYSYTYWISFQIICTFLLLNTVVAIVFIQLEREFRNQTDYDKSHYVDDVEYNAFTWHRFTYWLERKWNQFRDYACVCPGFAPERRLIREKRRQKREHKALLKQQQQAQHQQQTLGTGGDHSDDEHSTSRASRLTTQAMEQPGATLPRVESFSRRGYGAIYRPGDTGAQYPSSDESSTSSDDHDDDDEDDDNEESSVVRIEADTPHAHLSNHLKTRRLLMHASDFNDTGGLPRREATTSIVHPTASLTYRQSLISTARENLPRPSSRRSTIGMSSPPLSSQVPQVQPTVNLGQSNSMLSTASRHPSLGTTETQNVNQNNTNRNPSSPGPYPPPPPPPPPVPGDSGNSNANTTPQQHPQRSSTTGTIPPLATVLSPPLTPAPPIHPKTTMTGGTTQPPEITPSRTLQRHRTLTKHQSMLLGTPVPPPPPPGPGALQRGSLTASMQQQPTQTLSQATDELDRQLHDSLTQMQASRKFSVLASTSSFLPTQTSSRMSLPTQPAPHATALKSAVVHHRGSLVSTVPPDEAQMRSPQMTPADPTLIGRPTAAHLMSRPVRRTDYFAELKRKADEFNKRQLRELGLDEDDLRLLQDPDHDDNDDDDDRMNNRAGGYDDDDDISLEETIILPRSPSYFQPYPSGHSTLSPADSRAGRPQRQSTLITPGMSGTRLVFDTDMPPHTRSADPREPISLHGAKPFTMEIQPVPGLSPDGGMERPLSASGEDEVIYPAPPSRRPSISPSRSHSRSQPEVPPTHDASVVQGFEYLTKQGKGKQPQPVGRAGQGAFSLTDVLTSTYGSPPKAHETPITSHDLDSFNRIWFRLSRSNLHYHDANQPHSATLHVSQLPSLLSRLLFPLRPVLTQENIVFLVQEQKRLVELSFLPHKQQYQTYLTELSREMIALDNDIAILEKEVAQYEPTIQKYSSYFYQLPNGTIVPTQSSSLLPTSQQNTAQMEYNAALTQYNRIITQINGIEEQYYQLEQLFLRYEQQYAIVLDVATQCVESVTENDISPNLAIMTLIDELCIPCDGSKIHYVDVLYRLSVRTMACDPYYAQKSKEIIIQQCEEDLLIAVIRTALRNQHLVDSLTMNRKRHKQVKKGKENKGKKSQAVKHRSMVAAADPSTGEGKPSLYRGITLMDLDVDEVIANHSDEDGDDEEEDNDYIEISLPPTTQSNPHHSSRMTPHYTSPSAIDFGSESSTSPTHQSFMHSAIPVATSPFPSMMPTPSPSSTQPGGITPLTGGSATNSLHSTAASPQNVTQRVRYRKKLNKVVVREDGDAFVMIDNPLNPTFHIQKQYQVTNMNLQQMVTEEETAHLYASQYHRDQRYLAPFTQGGGNDTTSASQGVAAGTNSYAHCLNNITLTQAHYISSIQSVERILDQIPQDDVRLECLRADAVRKFPELGHHLHAIDDYDQNQKQLTAAQNSHGGHPMYTPDDYNPTPVVVDTKIYTTGTMKYQFNAGFVLRVIKIQRCWRWYRQQKLWRQLEKLDPQMIRQQLRLTSDF